MTTRARTAPPPHRAAHLASLLSLALGLLAAPACHDSAAVGPEEDTAISDAPDVAEVVHFDTAAPDTALADTALADTVPADTVPLPGELGWPCTAPDDCNGGWCLEGRDSRVCSKACTASCPLPGWTCRQNVAILPDIAFVCMPPMPTLCRPCTTNADCVTAADTTAHACVPLGDDGAFCGGLCATDDDCPSDAFCSTVKDVAGNTTRQCLPSTGVCECSGSAIAAGAATTCVHTSAYGRCAGARRCAESGLSACDAPTPVLDACDGVDSNCDGQTDEAFLAAPCELESAAGRCPGLTVCGPDGVTCDAPEPSPERCGNGVDDDCDGQTDDEGAAGCALTWYDGDGDAHGAGEPRCLCAPEGAWSASAAGDCDDAARRVYEGAAELCNALDDDCDGQTDEEGALGCTIYHADADGDGFGAALDARCLCAPEGVYTALSASDCDDANDGANPAAGETCNGADDDCDGETDEEGAAGCGLYFQDGDLDHFGAPNSFRCLCGPDGVFTATTGGDCDDAPPGGSARNPGLAEACDGVDNDCDGLTDEPGAEGCVLTYRDHDGDGFGLVGDALCLCGDEGEYRATVAGDCDDDEARAHPGAAEACDGVDNDCDDVVDEEDATGCTTWHADRDRDEHGVAEARCLCAAAIPFTATSTDDCDDSNPFIHPGGAEVCNALDDDCNGATDEGVTGQCSPFYKDADHDGWGDAAASECLCGPDGEFTSTRAGDCDDARTSVYPFAQELCNGGRDDDCDGETDERDALGCVVYFKDADGDGAGVASDSRCLCAPDPALAYTALAPGDCDDGDGDAAPGEAEVCNAKDDDCDGLTDERGAIGCAPYMRDTDHDTWGVALDTQCLCAPSATYAATRGGDCDDSRADISPGEAEVCDGVDNDCNGVADDPGVEGCTVRYRDRDGDTFGVSSDALCTCAPLGTYTATRGGDCQDLLGAVNPDATERCNAVDDDCDGATDEQDAVGCVAFLADGDGDGFGVSGQSRCLCQAGPVYRAVVGGDCDDARAEVNPGETEICNEIDDDCDGHTDGDGAAGCLLRYRDGDRDHYGVDGDTRCACVVAAPYDATVGGDCDDTSGAVKPNVGEVCNGYDDDCDGLIDEEGAAGCADRYLDADGDGWGVAGRKRCLCGAQGAYAATQTPDCDDGDARRAPDEVEACDGFDNDCDGQTDEAGATGCSKLWLDVDGDTWGVTGSELCLCGPVDDYDGTRGGDCDDDAGATNPAATEICNSVDDDCDGVVDEGCGIATVGWPTFMHDNRRTGQLIGLVGPSAGTLTWQRTLAAGVAFEGSPVVSGDGFVFVILANQLYKLGLADGATAWTHTLPAAPFSRASPTLRLGGTVVAPAGNQVRLVSAAGGTLWTRDFGGAAGDKVVGSPLVDTDGRIYVISNTHVRKLDEAGAVVWATPITNTASFPSELALGVDGRLYFATATAVVAMKPTGEINWTWTPPGAVPGASVALTEIARVLVPAGDTLYLLADGGGAASVVSSLAFGGDVIRANPGVYSNARQTGNNNPSEFPAVAPGGPNGLRMLKSNMTLNWSVAVPHATGKAVAPPTFDNGGDVYIGSDSATAGQGADFSSRKASNGSARWTYRAGGAAIDGAAAVGPGYVIFGDSAGTIYRVGN